MVFGSYATVLVWNLLLVMAGYLVSSGIIMERKPLSMEPQFDTQSHVDNERHQLTITVVSVE